MDGDKPSQPVALVTGASSGIGRAIAIELAAAGIDLALVGRRARELSLLAAEIAEQGRLVEVLAVDLAESKQLETVVDRTVESLGRLDILINGAGQAGWVPALETDREFFDAHLCLNAWVPLRLAQLAHPHLAEAPDGVVVMIGSVDAIRPSAGAAAYGASKGALSSLTVVLAKEWARAGIRVVQVDPGLISTPMAKSVLGPVDSGRRRINLVGRSGKPAEVAALVRYLVSAAGRFATGTSFRLDGGALATGPFDLWEES